MILGLSLSLGAIFELLELSRLFRLISANNSGCNGISLRQVCLCVSVVPIFIFVALSKFEDYLFYLFTRLVILFIFYIFYLVMLVLI